MVLHSWLVILNQSINLVTDFSEMNIYSSQSDTKVAHVGRRCDITSTKTPLTSMIEVRMAKTVKQLKPKVLTLMVLHSWLVILNQSINLVTDFSEMNIYSSQCDTEVAHVGRKCDNTSTRAPLTSKKEVRMTSMFELAKHSSKVPLLHSSAAPQLHSSTAPLFHCYSPPQLHSSTAPLLHCYSHVSNYYLEWLRFTDGHWIIWERSVSSHWLSDSQWISEQPNVHVDFITKVHHRFF